MYSGYRPPGHHQPEQIPLDDNTPYRGFTPTINENNSYYAGHPHGGPKYPHSESMGSLDNYSMGVMPQNEMPRDYYNNNMFTEPPRPPPPSSHAAPMLSGGPSGGVGGRFGGRFRNVKWSKLPYFCWTVSIIQICVFIAELAKMGELTGSPIQTQPAFNPMIGPSPYVQIHMGARFTPCMHAIKDVTDVPDLQFPCPNSTDIDSNVCSLSELCGMGGIKDGSDPDQWWRFITPIFLHGGIIHIGFNLLLQLKLGADLEKDIGIIRFILVYFASGIAGFVLGGNFTPDGISSTGASGSLFGVIALDLLDLLFNWQLYVHPVRNLIFHILEIGVSFVLGLLPGLDNFSHIGGFAMGILVGTAILRSPLKIRMRSVDVLRPQSYIDDNGEMRREMKTEQRMKVAKFHWKEPHKHFQNRSPWWFVWLAVRAACIGLAIAYFITLIRQFENGGGHCSWCKRLSCLPVHGWCDQGQITTTST